LHSTTATSPKTAMPAELQSTSQGQTLILTLRNPERRNAIDPVMYAAGVEALFTDVDEVVFTPWKGVFIPAAAQA